jgi:hypothetical protein
VPHAAAREFDPDHYTTGGSMPKPNYRHLKKQREAAKKREQQERLAKRQPPRPAETEPKEVP